MAAEDVIACFDAESGETLWKAAFESEETGPIRLEHALCRRRPRLRRAAGIGLLRGCGDR